MNNFVLYYVSHIAKHIISSLSHGDRLGLIGLTDVISSPNTGTCSELSMLYVTENTKPDLLGFVASLTQSKGNCRCIYGIFVNAIIQFEKYIIQFAIIHKNLRKLYVQLRGMKLKT